jgi:ABC-type branched-subunit amino acid transport system substrate-binding protein
MTLMTLINLDHPSLQDNRAMNKTILNFILSVLLILINQTGHSQNLVSTEAATKLGIIIPMSGMFETQGIECRRGYELAYSLKPEKLRKEIKLVFEDDQSLPKNAVSAFQRLSTSENLLAVSAFGSSSALAISDLSNTKKIPVLALSAHPDFTERTELGFSHWLDASFEADMFLEAFSRDKITKLAIITYENDYPLAIRDTIINKWSANKVFEIVFDEKINDQSDHRGLIPKLIKQDPDAIFLNVLGPSFSQLTRLLFENGFRGHKYSLNSNARHDYLIAAGMPASDGFVFFGPDFTEDIYLKNLSEDLTESAEHSYSFSCYLGMTFMLNTALKLQDAGTLNKESFNQALKESESIKFPGREIPIKNRRIIYDFTELVSNKGMVKLKIKN